MTPAPVLFLDHAEALGGAERSLILILRQLDRARWQPHFAGVNGPVLDHVRSLKVPTYPMSLPRLRGSPPRLADWLNTARGIAHIAREVGAGVIYANTVRTAFYAAAAARLARRPFVWHMRDYWLTESRPNRLWADSLLKRLLCSAAANVIVNTQATAAHLPADCSPSVIYNAIEAEYFDPGLVSSPFRSMHGIPDGAPLVGMVGRLRPWKGQIRFLRVGVQIAELFPDVRFLIVGGAIFGVDDAYAAGLHHLSAELGLADRVVFTGHMDDVRPALAAMDVFVHPGDPEPFGLVNLEAMAMEKPVVAFAHGALPEIVVHEETGILVQPADESALADAVCDLLTDTMRRQKMGRAARNRVKNSFNPPGLAMQIDEILSSVMV